MNTYFINGNRVSRSTAKDHWVYFSVTGDVSELVAVFDKADTYNGEDQRDLLLSAGIEIIMS